MLNKGVPPEEAGRLIIVGAAGLIGSSVAREAAGTGIEVIPVGRGETVADLVRSGDVVLNCALHPDYRRLAYEADKDLDRHAAAAAHRAGARVVMLSTRKVYVDDVQWGAREDDPVVAAGAGYGPNKARTEAWLRDTLGDSALIVRLSNVFGFEYAPDQVRRSFFGLMLNGLKSRGEILFDMSPSTRRDFIPVNDVATALLAAVRRRRAGTYNLGAGAPIACGDIAGALIQGYGEGRLCATDDIRDEFYLDCKRWNSEISIVDPQPDVLTAVRGLGEQLRHA